jgi:Phycobilisome protein
MPLSEPSPLAQQWARKYVDNLSTAPDPADALINKKGLKAEAANRLLDLLRQVSLKAWSQTEALLGDEIQRHEIDRRLINPWEISQDAYNIYEKALEFYTQNTSYSRLPAIIGPDIAKIRKKYTTEDPRVIAFVSMQFHYTGLMLQGRLSTLEKRLLGNCFSIIDDHLYMPLHRAYSAAGKHQSNSPKLILARNILDYSTDISKIIVEQVAQIYPRYKTYTGNLTDPIVMNSSRRDVVMFQIYLIVCVLEESPAIIQEELFPLCVMLYPKLKVHWELVRLMLQFIGQEVGALLGKEKLALFSPYLHTLRDMFSPEVFYED